MKQNLYRVSVKHKETGEKLKLYVWAKNVDEATHSLTGSLIGPDCEYAWEGSGPEHRNNELITRDIPEKNAVQNKLLQMLNEYENLVEIANAADSAYEADPENEEKEAAFEEAYKKEWDAGEELIGEIVKRSEGKIGTAVARKMLHTKREELRELFAKVGEIR